MNLKKNQIIIMKNLGFYIMVEKIHKLNILIISSKLKYQREKDIKFKNN